MSNIQHSSVTSEWYTPGWVVDFITEQLGGPIDFDPCSCAVANRQVRATEFLTREQDGLSHRWPTGVGLRVLVNPPGSPGGRLVQQFARRSVQHALANPTARLAFLCFSISQLATLSQIFSAVPHHVFVFRNRIKFLDSNGNPSTRPSHANAVVFMGLRSSRASSPHGVWYEQAPA